MWCRSCIVRDPIFDNFHSCIDRAWCGKFFGTADSKSSAAKVRKNKLNINSRNCKFYQFVNEVNEPNCGKCHPGINEMVINHLRVKPIMDKFYHSKELMRCRMFRPEVKLFRSVRLEVMQANRKDMLRYFTQLRKQTDGSVSLWVSL